MTGKIAILIDATLHNELVLRTRKSDDVTHIIEQVIETFLEQTAHDKDVWSEAYINDLQKIEGDAQLSKYGSPQKGYRWQAIFLPNGTILKIIYKGREHLAEIRHQNLLYQGKNYSPSEWARLVANNTNRNAWRDVWILFPGSSQWKLADVLRRSEKDQGT